MSEYSKKVAEVKRDSIKKLPNKLIVVLKMFELDFDTISKNKGNDYFVFPMEFNLKLFKAENAQTSYHNVFFDSDNRNLELGFLLLCLTYMP